MATVEIIPIPIGSAFIEDIGADDDADLNDIPVRLVFDENVTGLELSDLSFAVVLTGSSVDVSDHVSIVSLSGENNVWAAVVRPPQPSDFSGTGATTGVITLTVAADSVNEGNPETSKGIRFSTSFPDTDAEVPSLLTSVSSQSGLTVTPSRLLTSSSPQIEFYTHAGSVLTSERLTGLGASGALEYINGDVLLKDKRRSLETGDILVDYPFADSSETRLLHTRLGVMDSITSTTEISFNVLPYGKTLSSDYETLGPVTGGRLTHAAHQNNLLFGFLAAATGGYFSLLRITDDDNLEFVTRLNIRHGASGSSFTVRDTALYRDTLYVLESSGIYTLDIRKYRPLALNTKTRMDVQFIDEGGTLPLTPFSPDAETFTFATGFDKPTYLSINSSNEIEVASSAVTETNPVLVKLTGINRIDSQDLSFYLVIRQAANPTVRDIDDLAMYASTTFNLFDIVDNATAITFRTGQTQPTSSSISGGIFTIGTAGGTAYFTATNANGSTNFEIAIDVVSVDPDNFSDTFRYRTEIAGIDVTADAKGTPTVSESIDEVRLNVVTANRVNLTLRSDSTNGFKFNGGIADNFWDANSLNADGFQEPVKVYIESLISGSYVRSLLFSGRIHEPAASISEAEVRISAVDISTRLRNTLVSDFGTLTKWDALKQQSDAVNYEGVNVPESSLLPIQLGTGTAWSDRTKLDISRLPLSSEGPAQSNTGYLTSQDFRTAGGFLASLPILRFKTEPRAEDVRFLIKQAAINKDIYQTQIDIPAIQRDTPFILNRGSVPFSVEDTRITRLPTDWAHDSTNDRVLNLLSNPESHIADLLVQYDLGSDSYRTLHTFDTDISVHRITRRTSTDYYILSAKAISQDRSAATLPRTVDSTGYAYDSSAEESEIKILRYNASTNTLTEHVPEDDDRPPQLGIHYHVGFENTIYIDEFEGIVAGYRGSFKWQGSNLYYRYATPSEFGVARVNTSGTTTEMIDQTDLNYHNHLNFAFDVNSSGDIYFVYSVGDTDESSLIIKRRTSAGVETTILTDTQDLADLTTLDDAGGAYLGAHEAIFHDDTIFIFWLRFSG